MQSGLIKRFFAKQLATIPALERFSQQRELWKAIRAIPDGQGLVRVHAEHPVEYIAALGKLFDEINEHHLLKPFLRHKPQLIIVHPELELPLLGQIKGAHISGKKVFMDTNTADQLTFPEIKALLAHEIAHHARLDTHARNSMRSILRRTTPLMEIDADKIAVAVTHDAAALDSAIKHLKEIHPEIKELDELVRKGNMWKKSQYNIVLGCYLPPEERSEFILKTGKKLEDPERRSHLEEQIKRRLQKEHDRLFGHHAHH